MFTFKRFKPKMPALCICGERPPAYPDNLFATCHEDAVRRGTRATVHDNRDTKSALGYYYECPTARVR
jgi:hypothetical protein